MNGWIVRHVVGQRIPWHEPWVREPTLWELDVFWVLNPRTSIPDSAVAVMIDCAACPAPIRNQLHNQLIKI